MLSSSSSSSSSASSFSSFLGFFSLFPSFTSSSSSRRLLPPRPRAARRDARRSSSLARAGERHRTTENKVFLRFPVLSRLSLPLFHATSESNIYARERRGFISARRAREGREKERLTKRNSSLSFSVSLSLPLVPTLSAPPSVSRTANQTVLHESRPLKRIVFHARRVTD